MNNATTITQGTAPSGLGVVSTSANRPPLTSRNGTRKMTRLASSLPQNTSIGVTGRLMTKGWVCSLRSSITEDWMA